MWYLPEEAWLGSPPLLDVPIQAVVGHVGAAAIKEARLDRPAPSVKVEACMVLPPLQPQCSNASDIARWIPHTLDALVQECACLAVAGTMP